jgi:hypothetical protein
MDLAATKEKLTITQKYEENGSNPSLRTGKRFGIGVCGRCLKMANLKLSLFMLFPKLKSWR